MSELIVLAEQIIEPGETKPNNDGISQTHIQEIGSEGIAQPKVDGYMAQVRTGLRCLNCGSPIHWASDICENCLADPLKDRRENARINLRKTFVYDDLLAKVCNISRGGVQIKTGSSLSVGEFRTIAFSLENGMLVFEGIVVYVQTLSGSDLLAGIRFTELTDRNSGLLNRLVCSHSIRRNPG